MMMFNRCTYGVFIQHVVSARRFASSFFIGRGKCHATCDWLLCLTVLQFVNKPCGPRKYLMTDQWSKANYANLFN